MDEPAAEHRRQAARHRARCAILTVSDSRSIADDPSGDLIARQLQASGHLIADRRLVRDEPAEIEAALRGWTADPDVDAVLCTGGTGFAPRDRTVDVVRRLVAQELEGFGELMRLLSFEQVGPAAMLSRATAGLIPAEGTGSDTFIFAMPGSPGAVELAMTRLIVPELGHLVWIRRPRTRAGS